MKKAREFSHIAYHVLVIILSAAAALSLPYAVRLTAQNFLIYWSHIENEKVFLVSVEIAVAVILIIFFTYLGRNWRERKLSTMARNAGLVLVSRNRNPLTRRRIRRLKEQHGFARDVMIIGSTGSKTFVDPEGDLHRVVQNCRHAKIMLLDPFSEGAWARAKSLRSPDITPESFREQIEKSIDFIKGLKAIQKDIRLKLYRDMPLFKLAVLGDCISMRHYHPGMDVENMPEYIFEHTPDPGGLNSTFYQYFLSRWNDPHIPEYDLKRDELIYRDRTGKEISRETLPVLLVQPEQHREYTRRVTDHNGVYHLNG